MITSPTQVLCVNRKITEHPVDPKQAAFTDRFAQGCNGALVSAQEATALPASHPWCIRGMKFTESVRLCWNTNRTFYYIDNGYFGNPGRKEWFRIIKNHVHTVGPIINRPRDRLDRCSLKLKPFTTGSKILIAPPSEKSFSLWKIDQTEWINNTVNQIKQHTDRPIEIRLKRKREDRMRYDTMEEALDRDVHCLVTYNSVAAVEALMLGKPAITLGPNAAGVLCSNNLADIDTPRIPTLDERDAWLRHLSYCQFTYQEMQDGTAWRILQENHECVD
jgi:hypothetical protein